MNGRIKQRLISKNILLAKKLIYTNSKKLGEAIAWLEWDGKYIVIKKFEKLPCAGKGAGTPLIEFLKSLADKYQVRISGNPMCYDPDPPIPCGPLLTQDQLEAWYEKHGFQIRKILNSDIPIMWYPDAPQMTSDAC